MAPDIRTFGPFTLDVAKFQLRKDGQVLDLSTVPLKVLIRLTDEPGEVVTFEQFRDTVWHHETDAEAIEGRLRVAIREIRALFGGPKEAYIATVRSRGYQFIFPIPPPAFSTGEPPDTGGLVGTDTPVGAGRTEKPRSRARQFRIAGFFVLTLALALAAAHYLSSRRPAAAEKTPLSLAVLPVQNITGQASNNPLSDGITDALITQTRMMTGRHLRVIAIADSHPSADQNKDVIEIGKLFAATYVLRCELQRNRSGIGLVFTMQLFRTADAALIWTRWFDGEGNDVLAEAGNLAGEIIAELPLGVRPDAKPSTYISSPVAEEAYLRGKKEQAERTQESLNAALDDFKRATQADNSFAQAFAQLAITYELLGQYGWMQQSEAVRKGDEAVDKALRLNNRFAEGFAARGLSHWFYHWDWKNAENDFRQAIELEGSNEDALHWYALALATAGRSNEAEQLMERALALDPKSNILRTNRGWLDYLNKKPQAAAEAMEAVLRDDPYFKSARFKLWAVYSLQKRYDEAFRQLNFLSLDSISADDREKLNQLYATQGYGAALLRWSNGGTQANDGNTLFKMQSAEFSGDRETAISVLTQAFNLHDGWLAFLIDDPALENLRKDPRTSTAVRLLTQQRQ